MSEETREDLLMRVFAASRDKVARTIPIDTALGWDVIAPVTIGLVFAQRPIQAATRDVTARYDLGPRGSFILSLIRSGLVYPVDLARMLNIGRSLVTTELARLTEAGLVVATPGQTDRRRSELHLTEEGERACTEVSVNLAGMLAANLSGYSIEEIRLFARMLHDVQRILPDDTAA